MDSESTTFGHFTRMDELPIECISHIFTFFTFEELNLLSSICKKWQQYCWMFQETITLSIQRRQKLKDVHLKHVAKCTELKALNLHRSRLLTNQGLQTICNLPKLNKLNLSFCSRITDEGIQHLRNLPNIRILLLSYCNQLTSNSFKDISLLVTLRELDLSGCGQLCNDGLEYLCQLKELQKLDLSYNKITKEGIDSLHCFKNMESFRFTTINSKEIPNTPSNWQVTVQPPHMKISTYPQNQDDSDEDFV